MGEGRGRELSLYAGFGTSAMWRSFLSFLSKRSGKEPVVAVAKGIILSSCIIDLVQLTQTVYLYVSV